MALTFHSNPFVHDLVATGFTLLVSLAWLQFVRLLQRNGHISTSLSRKFLHIGTGPFFVLCWPLFSEQPAARFMAAVVPLILTGQFFLIGIGVLKDEPTKETMARSGDRRELLKGPLIYGLVFIACTLLFWRDSPVGITTLMILAGGDGLAELIGRVRGRSKLPWNPAKSWIGTIAMFLGGSAFTAAILLIYNTLHLFQPPLRWPDSALAVLAVAAGAAVVETLPLENYDNFTITVSALLLGSVLF